MRRVLLDTNACIAFLRGQSPDLLARAKRHEPGDIGLSAVVLAELEYGAQRSAERVHNLEAISRLTGELRVHPFDASAAKAYGALRAYLERSGNPIGALDTLIAAQALALDATLVTRNIREFRRIPGLTVEDWS